MGNNQNPGGFLCSETIGISEKFCVLKFAMLFYASQAFFFLQKIVLQILSPKNHLRSFQGLWLTYARAHTGSSLPRLRKEKGCYQ